ncbi:MAG: NBR1-Ig-like domain-containing protein [Anaerolineae bacterium]|nr:NBR1-Ig-like domain-containing protein [Anaerolineae bacterium]
MNRWSIPVRIILFLMGLAFFSACIPGEKLPSAEEVKAAIETSVAQTIQAQEQIANSVALTVAVLDPGADSGEETATSTVTLSPTLTPILGSATSFTIVPSSSGGSGGGAGSGSGGTTSYAYSCDIIRQRPIDNTEFKRTNTFDVKFTILNNGTSTWVAGKDLVLLGNPGPTLTSPPAAPIQLPEMKPGDTFPVGPFDAVAPDTAGHYVIDFKLEGGFCYPYVAFDVIR